MHVISPGRVWTRSSGASRLLLRDPPVSYRFMGKYAHTYTHTREHTYMHTYLSAHMHTQTPVHTGIHTCAHAHTYIHIRAHAHTRATSSPAFCIMYSAYKLNKQSDNIQSWCTPFPVWKQCVVPCLVLTVASWQVSQEAGKVVWYPHLFKNFPQFVVIHTVKGFSRVNEA